MDREEALRRVHASIRACRECESRHGFSITKPSAMERGSIGAKVIAVGIAPGTQAAKKRVAFAGHSFTRLHKTFAAAGFCGAESELRALVYLTSVLKCAPPDDRVRTRKVMAATCLHFLWEQAEIIEPQFGLILGEAAFNSLIVTGLQFGESAGLVFESSRLFGLLDPPGSPGMKWLVTPHPSPLSRLWNKPATVDQVVSSLSTLLRGLDQS